jgi:diguanylate cyclase (GGDEF)-like protein/PAS domain S-box-containing protein
LDFVHPEDASGALESLRALAQRSDAELGPLVFTWRLTRADGKQIKVEHTFSRTRTPSGPVLLGILQRALDDDPAYRKLLDSEARFRGLLSLSSDWYWEQDAEFRFTMFAGQRHDGLPSGASALIGKRRWDSPGEPIGTTWEEHIGLLEARKPFRDLILHRTAVFSEQPIIIRVHGDPVFDEYGKFLGYRGTASDITKEKRAELSIADAEARYRALVNVAPDGIVVLNEGVIEFANDTFIEMMRAQGPQAFIGRQMLDFIHPSYVEDVRERAARLMRQELRSDAFKERKLVRMDGTTLLAEMRGTIFTAEGRTLIQSIVRDISRYREIEDNLRKSEERFRDMAQAAGEYLWEVDAQGRYTYLSDRVVDVLGHTQDWLIGRRPMDFMPEEERQLVANWFSANAREGGFRNLEHRSITRSGETIWQRVSGVAIYDEQGQAAGFRGTGLDITLQKVSEQQVRRMATHDTLTGLPNRALLQDRLQQALSKSERDRLQVGVLFIDLDKFKRINDLLGHSSGDELLRQASRRLTEILRGQDTLCRIGGDEFVAIIENAGSRQELERTAARIIAVLTEEFFLTGGRFTVGASVGISMYPGDAQTPEELIRRADSAMYQAKKRGGGQSAVYSAELGPGTDERFRFEIELRRAITQREFRVHLQPIFDAQDGVLVGAEALIRWQHPERGLLPPGRFIPAAEAANLISTLGDWIINEVAEHLHEWYARTGQLIKVSVNVSVQQLATGLDFVEFLEGVVHRHQLPPECLVLEVTESLLVQSIDVVVSTLRAARELGMQVAMDDFGTGYSSLHVLRQLPIDTIKVDRAFVRYLERGAKDFAVLAAVIQLARALDLKVVAEGIEEPHQVELLRELGFDYMQGFYFAKPMPVEEFAARYVYTQTTSEQV